MYSSEHFFNRELSWLEFNARVLEEAQDTSNPLLERVKFLAIVSSNLDEFFMVRVAGLREQAFGDLAPQDVPPDGMLAITQLPGIAQKTQQMVAAQSHCWRESIQPALAKEGIAILRPKQLRPSQMATLHNFFQERAFPVLTPMAIDPAHPTPRFHNRGVYLAVTLQRDTGLGPKDLFAVVQIPQVLPRFVPVGEAGKDEFVFLEDVIADRLPELFGGFTVKHWTTFRITRDMDIDLLDEEGDDLLRQIEDRLRKRLRSEAVRLEIAQDASDDLVEMIIDEEDLHVPNDADGQSYGEVYRIDAPLDLTGLWELARIKGYDHLRAAPFTPRRAFRVPPLKKHLFGAIAAGDIMLHHPYDSFDTVVDFVKHAANDPDVLAIKQTLYRTSGDSPIVQALMEAAANGKQVTALVELKARFDEENNVDRARQMERAGVHVVYGFLDLKTHCKILLVVRREGNQLRRYVHLGTGNYNPITAQIYTDIGIFTANEEIANDATALFNLLTGYSQGHEWKKLIIAPHDMQRRTIEMIDEQARRAEQGLEAAIFAKLNALVCPDTIAALYRASEAGVKIDLVVRGICSLRPGMPKISENIQVRSIVGRFLEHSRIYIFGPPDEAKIYLSSADWMPRNFRRRVEVMFPVESPALRSRVLDELVPSFLRDNLSARVLQADGTYVRLQPAQGEEPYRCQDALMGLPSPATEEDASLLLAADDADSPPRKEPVATGT